MHEIVTVHTITIYRCDYSLLDFNHILLSHINGIQNDKYF